MEVNANVLRSPPLQRGFGESAISWSAVLGGAAAAAALALILLALGAGLGLSSVSPWSYRGPSATALAAGTIIWLLVTSLCASGLGGYIAGATRAKWELATERETHFRDTVHGFLAWSVATLVSAALLSSAASSMVGAAATIGAGAAAAAPAMTPGLGSTGSGSDSTSYFVDMMFRGSKSSDAGGNTTDLIREVRGILAASMATEMSRGDKAYLAQLVSSRTGLSPVDAEQRVTQTSAAAKLAADAAVAKARDVTEAARKATARAALWVFVSLLVGAFYASLAATWGGRQRDPESYVRRRV